jgi:hypothetical protein
MLSPSFVPRGALCSFIITELNWIEIFISPSLLSSPNVLSSLVQLSFVFWLNDSNRIFNPYAPLTPNPF